MATSTNITQERIIDRIKKLLKHSESAKSLGSLQEAETFAQKASELLLEYNLEMSQIDMADDAGDKFADWAYEESIKYGDNQSGSRWKLALIGVLVEHNLCSYTFNSYQKTFRVYGKGQNVDVAVWLYNFLSVALLRLAQVYHVNLDEDIKRGRNRYAILKDFLLGAVAGIDQKMERERSSNNKVTSMVLVNKGALEEYQKQHLGPLKTAKKSKPINVDATHYFEGVKAGMAHKVGQSSTAIGTQRTNRTPEQKRLK